MNLSKFTLLSAFLLIACTVASQERQIRNNDTCYLIPAWRLRVSLEKFARLDACLHRLENTQNQISFMQRREQNHIQIAQTDSAQIRYIKQYNLDLVQLNKQQAKKIKWLQLQRIGLIALVIIAAII